MVPSGWVILVGTMYPRRSARRVGGQEARHETPLEAVTLGELLNEVRNEVGLATSR